MGERMPGQRNSMFYGAMLLTAGSIGLRLVQLAFQVYISGVMGAAGLGRMQLIMTVGGFAAILASPEIPGFFVVRAGGAAVERFDLSGTSAVRH